MAVRDTDEPKPTRRTRTTAVEASSTAERTAPPWWVEIPKLLATGAIAALATIVVGYFTFFNQSRELDIKMVELSLSILAGERGGVVEDKAGTQAYGEYEISRLFALRALSRYSGVALSTEEMQAWAESGSISFGELAPDLQAYQQSVSKMVASARDFVLVDNSIGIRFGRFTLGRDLSCERPLREMDILDYEILKMAGLREAHAVWWEENCPNAGPPVVELIDPNNP
jgi:hypothetical protein